MRIRDRDGRRDYGYGHRGGVISGLMVIAVGILFLLDNLGFHLFFEQENWWAWLILVAAVGPVLGALERYRRVGSIDGGVLRALLSAAAIVMVAVIFLLDLPWDRWWPVFVIYGGLCMLVRDRRCGAGEVTR